LQTLVDRRNRLSAISDQTPKIKTNIENLNKDIERLSRTKEKINVIGVAKGTGNPVYLDSISDEQYIYVADANGKQKRKLYSGPVDRSTSNVTARAKANAKLPPLEGAEQKGKGELNVKQYAAIAESAAQGRKTLPALEKAASVLNQGFDTGWLTDTKVQAARVLGALGVKDAENYATSGQTFLAQGRQILLQRQLEQKGAQSEGDAARMEQTFVQLGNTSAANKFLVAAAKAQIKQVTEQQKFYSGWWTKNKTYEGAEDAWVSGEGGKSIFDYPEMKMYATSSAGNAPPPPPGFKIVNQ
jgi:hypothetical protein